MTYDPTSLENVNGVLGRWALGEGLPERAKRDGCGCPPWVIRCTHFGGRILWLGAEHASHQAHTEQCLLRVPPYGVGTVERFDVCANGCGVLIGAGDIQPGGGYDSEADAIAAFEAEEARLLGREVPS